MPSQEVDEEEEENNRQMADWEKVAWELEKTYPMVIVCVHCTCSSRFDDFLCVCACEYCFSECMCVHILKCVCVCVLAVCAAWKHAGFCFPEVYCL